MRGAVVFGGGESRGHSVLVYFKTHQNDCEMKIMTKRVPVIPAFYTLCLQLS
jgi:hypothetical protein